MTSIDAIITTLRQLAAKKSTVLVAIDGRGGSGKSTLASRLQQELSYVTIVHLDDFAYPHTDRERLLKEVIYPVKKHTLAKYQRFDWGTKQLAEWHEIQPDGIVIIEGVSTLHDTLYKHFDYKIWVECPAEIGFQRGLKRDTEIYKVDTEKDWINTWMPAEKKYIEEQNPQEKADYILDTSMLQ